MNADGIVAEWNDRAAEMFGWASEEVIGRTMADFIIPMRFRSAHHNGLRKFLDTGVGPLLGKRIEVSAIRKNGEEFPVELSIAPLKYGNNVIFIGCLRDIEERKRADERQKLLLAELNHRVKNMLAVINGIASQTARTSLSLADFDDKFRARLHALSRAHSMLTDRSWGETLLAELISEITSPHVGDRQLDVSGPPVMLTPDTTLTMSLLLHELLTNATKHGALSIPEGQLSIKWNVTGAHLNVIWRETGLSNLIPPKNTGFGSKLIEASLRQDLRGQLSVAYEPTGVHYQFKFAL